MSIAIIDKSEIQKIPSPDNLFVMFIDGGIIPYQVVHRKKEGNQVYYSIYRKFEGCAILKEQEVDLLKKRYPKTNWKIVTLTEISKELPVFINFPAGHKLANDVIEIRSINGEIDFLDLKSLK